jgi:PPOX class probable F420-dependent enzyme
MGAPLSEGARRVIDKDNFAHVATVMPDGSPQVSPVWIHRHGDQVLISTLAHRQKRRNLDKDPRIALSIADAEMPFPPVQIRGRVVETLRGEAAIDVFVEMTRKYGRPDPDPSVAAQRIIYVIDVDSVVAPAT